jgi:hypothetical protein
MPIRSGRHAGQSQALILDRCSPTVGTERLDGVVVVEKAGGAPSARGALSMNTPSKTISPWITNPQSPKSNDSVPL